MTTQSFRRDRENNIVLGVCAGLARRYGWDVTLIRAGLVVLTLCGVGFPALGYLVVGLLAD